MPFNAWHSARTREKNASHKQFMSGRRPLLELLEARQMLDGAGLFAGNDCPPDLDLSNVSPQTIRFGEQLAFNLFSAGATVEDLDASGSPTGDTIRVVADPDIGTDTPVGVTLTEVGDFSWTPTEDQVGLHTITVIAIDGGTPALADAETFQVRVLGVNESPDLTPIADQQAAVGNELVVNVTATDANDGDTLTFFLDPNDAPAGATIEQTSNTTATVRWTPEAGDLPGPTSFTVLVSDDGSLPLVDSESFNVTLTGSNVAPDLAAIADQAATVGSQMVVNITATDANAGDTLTFSLDKDNGATPADAILQQTSNTTATVRWTPDLADVGSPVPFRVLVTDNASPAEGDSEDFEVTVSAATGSMVLAEGSSFRAAMTEAVELGQNEGTRTLAFDIETAFDETDTAPAVEDLFQVFLVDANDPTQTLLDNGTAGTAVFSLAGGKAEYQPGQVRYDGSRVEIDVTALGDRTSANLVFQILNSDGDEGTTVALGPVRNTTNTAASPAPRLARASNPSSPSGELETANLAENDQVEITVQNVRFDSASGDYTAEVVARNNGPAIGRQLAVVFPGLPGDVTFENASGVDGSGNPYINLTDAIGSGGLAAGASSRPVTIRLSNPNSSRFSLTPTVLSGGANTAPTLGVISPITAVPGDYIELQLDGQDANGDTLTYSLSSPDPLPGGMLMADGKLIFQPAPGQQGSYDFTVRLSDGVETVTRSSSITVETDPITTTRFSGRILDTNETALVGMTIEIRGADGTVLLNTTTDASGDFFLESATPIAADTVVIRGDLLSGSEVYPFIAEKLPLVLGHEVYDGAKNVVFRPIYLPALDVEGGTPINPTQNTTVAQEIAPGEMASVFVQAGSLMMDDGTGNMVSFTGTLSITEVPRDLTPASLPPNLLPDTVVTIQPGEMVFTDPAELTLPNRGNFAPGTAMDLWSINPETGDFDKVGTGRVTSDGAFIETVSGGINNSSWHLFGPITPTQQSTEDIAAQESGTCGCPKEVKEITSEVELHSGALRETHDLVAYQSLGQQRGLQLYYNSLHADPQPIVAFGYDNIPAFDDRTLIAEVEITRGEFTYQLPGYEGGRALDGGQHFWTLPAAGGDITVALQADLSDLPTGAYDFVARSGLFNQTDDGQFTGTSADTTGQVFVTNLTESPFGAGWSLAGQQVIVENPDGSVLLLDGGGRRTVFEPHPTQDGQFLQPPADFSTLERLGDGTYRRTLTDQTVYEFDADHRLTTMTDRVGRVTEWQYDVGGDLVKWIDPAGLETTFNYTGGLVSSIVDPAGRATNLEYDTAGNLVRITDPDDSSRTFGYYERHRLTSEIDQRGFLEESFYGFDGRVERAIQKDGTERFVQSAQTVLLRPAEETTTPETAPVAPITSEAVGSYADANGAAEQITLDRFGQRVQGSDSAGSQQTVTRSANNLIESITEPDGRTVSFTYDERGNLLSRSEPLGSLGLSNAVFPGASIAGLPNDDIFAYADFNSDGILDIASAGFVAGSDFVTIALSNQDGYEPSYNLPLPVSTSEIVADDFDADGNIDLLIRGTSAAPGFRAVVLYGGGGGGFSSGGLVGGPAGGVNATVGDYNGDSLLDLAALSAGGVVTVSLGRQDRTIGDPVDVPLPDGVTFVSLESVDVNQDDIDELVGVEWSTGAVLVASSTEAGALPSRFEQQIALPEGVNGSVRPADDLNEDGFNDILVTLVSTSPDGPFTQGYHAILSGSSGALESVALINEQPLGTISTAPIAIDINGDDQVEVVVGSDVYQFNAGSFTQVEGINPPVGNDIIDIDGDGNLDVVSGHVVYRGTAGGGFEDSSRFRIDGTTEFFRFQPRFADTDTDGSPDTLLFATADAFSNPGADDASWSIDLLTGLQDDRQTRVTLPVQGELRALEFGDINGDGFGDLVFLTAENDSFAQLAVRLGQDGGGYAESVPLSTPLFFSPESLGVGDLDNDGNADVVVTGQSELRVLTSLGDGTFEVGPRQQAPFFVGETKIIDVTGDDNADIIASGRVLVNQGDGVFVRTTDVSSRGIDFADFNGDGLIDVASFQALTIGVDIHINLGGGEFSRASRVLTEVSGFALGSMQAADFNGDGFGDLLIEGSLYTGDGLGGFTFDSFYSLGFSPTDTADIDGDGTPDIGGFQTSGTAGSLENYGFALNLGGTGLRQGAVGEKFTYEPVFNQLTSFTDELGHATLYEIDPANGNRLSTREVVGEVDDAVNLETDDLVTTFTYTSLGLIDTTTDPLGRVTDFDYDSFGRLTTVTFAFGTEDEAFQSFEYDTAGNQTAVIDENGNRTEFAYDSLNRLTQITEPDPDGAGPLTSPVTAFTYDARGNLLTTTDARGNVTTNAYDPLSRLASTTDADDGVTTFGYDMAGNLARVTDPLGFTTSNEYDGRNRLVETTDPEGGVTQFAYDTDDNLVSVLDPVGNETLFRYDARDRLVQETDPLGATTVYSYDAADNLIRKTDRNGRATEFAYDDLDRLTTETWLGDDGTTAVNTIDYAYDKASNLLSVVDAFSALAFTYDNRNRVDTVDNDGTPNTPRVVLDYAYDGVGNVTSVSDTIDGVAGATTSYAYDALNRTTTIQQSGNNVADKLVDFVYNELGQFDEIARYSDLGRNNLVALSDYEYDELNRLTDLDHTNAADEVLAFYDFEYDPSSRITKLTDIDGATDYSYDDRSQLTGADRDAADSRGDESYAYDENDNRTDSHLHGDGYVTGDGNRLLSDGTYDYEYDAEGNMTKRTEVASGEYREFEWDYRNRLVRVIDFSPGDIITQEVEFAYDTLDRRIAKTVDADGAGAGGEESTLFIYDREDVLLDFVDTDGIEALEASVLDLRYMHGPGIDQVLAQENGAAQWLLADHIGTVRDIISNSGTILNHLSIDSYGVIIGETSGLVATRYVFAGREYDALLGLYYYRARYYSAEIGSFVSEDPVGFGGGDLNLFRYASNTPVTNIDLFGLQSVKTVGKVAGGVSNVSDLTDAVETGEHISADLSGRNLRDIVGQSMPRDFKRFKEDLVVSEGKPTASERARSREEALKRFVQNPRLDRLPNPGQCRYDARVVVDELNDQDGPVGNFFDLYVRGQTRVDRIEGFLD